MSQHHAATAPTDCTVVVINVSPGDSVRAGAIVAIVEMMKIEHLVTSPVDGKVGSIVVQLGDVLTKGQTILEIAEGAVAGEEATDDTPAEATERADLQELHERRALLADEARPDAITRPAYSARERRRSRRSGLLR
jgi:pyruvate/2-oxoglutarate dehydrogenase complex dihydrolipoamide acyltransferase (E2) component